jgi:sugar lactone lactonase YvrE
MINTPWSRIATYFLIGILCISAFLGTAMADTIKEDAYYPEGPTVNGHEILWAEMSVDRIRRLVGGVVSTIWQETGCGPTAVKRSGLGPYWVLCHLGHKVVRLSSAFVKEAEITQDVEGHRIMWPNDAVPDLRGGLFFTSSGLFSLEAPAAGYVLHASFEGRARRIAGPIRYANGISFDQEHMSLFVSEHLARRIVQLFLNSNYSVIRSNTFFDFNKQSLPRPDYPLAGPDGQIILKDGSLVVAEYGAGRLLRISRDGMLTGVIAVPMKYVTNLVQSPFSDEELIVTGSFDNEHFPMPGQVISVRIPD